LDWSGVEFERYIGRSELFQRVADTADGGMIVASIIVRGGPYARLVVGQKRNGGAFTDEDKEAISLLTEQAAVAIENATSRPSAGSPSSKRSARSGTLSLTSSTCRDF